MLTEASTVSKNNPCNAALSVVSLAMPHRCGNGEMTLADNNKPEPKKKTAPYLPFKTFMNSLDTFSQGVPGTLDRTIWKSQAGLMQGLIMNTYRFFGLVDEFDAPN